MQCQGQLQLPLASDIYDFDSQELHGILQKLDLYLSGVKDRPATSPEHSEHIENAAYIKGLIQAEIEERAAVQSFGRMCMNYKPDDNPFDFLKRFDDFNRQLQKLVEQGQDKQQNGNSAERLAQLQRDGVPTSKHLASDTSANTTDSERFRPELMTNSSQYTLESSEKSVKMGLNNKKRKSGASDMMMKLLARTKLGDNQVVIGKGSQTKKAEMQKHHPPRPHPAAQQPPVIKLTTGQLQKASQLKKTQEIVHKPKPHQSSAEKPKQTTKQAHPKPAPKIASNKEILEMIRKEEHEKKAKVMEKTITTSQQIPQPPLQQVAYSVTVQSNKDFEGGSLQLAIPKPNVESQQQGVHRVDGPKAPIARMDSHEQQHIAQVAKPQFNQIKEEEIEDSVAQDTVKLNNLKDLVLEAREQCRLSFQQPNAYLQADKAAVTVSETTADEVCSIAEEIKMEQEEEQKEEQHSKAAQPRTRLIRNSTASSRNSNSTVPRILNQESRIIEPEAGGGEGKQEQQRPRKAAVEEKEDKECYSQNYWNNVKLQANENLQRLKRMREQREMERVIVNDQVNKALEELQEYKAKAAEIIGRSEKPVDEHEPPQPKKPLHEQPAEETLKPSLKPKPKKQKRKEEMQVAPVRQLPAQIEDYLSHFASFNHLFSVYYLKPSNEAILDIQSTMRQMYALFTIHREVMESQNYRRPLFTPFDNNNTVYINEPRQLLAHAQTTHIDIKQMISRLSVFNENLHGRFDDEKETMSYRVVKNREEVYDIVTTSFLRVKGWRQLPHGMNLKTSWNLFWTWAKPELDLNKLLVFQKVNHFPLNKNLSRKDLLYKNMEYFRRQLKTSVTFMPLTYNLPKEFSQFSAKFHEDQLLEGANNIWIMKPIGKSRGRGIKLVNNIADLSYVDNIVVQKYIRNPLLLDGYKFDMRIYVLVTSIHPLEAFVYREGFARLSTEKFTMQADSIKNTFIHLTNFAIQKNNREAAATFEDGSKISFKNLQEKLEKMGVRWHSVWDRVHEIIAKSLLACSMGMPRFPSAFELFGYDVMIDDLLNCSLIEINSSPSLERSFMIDELIKQSLIDDIIELLDLPNFDRKECCDVFAERLARKVPATPQEDNIDIARILRFRPLRRVGELPKKMGLFERVAPEKRTEELERLVEAKFNPNIRYLDN